MLRLSGFVFSSQRWVVLILLICGLIGTGLSHAQDSASPTVVPAEDPSSVVTQETDGAADSKAGAPEEPVWGFNTEIIKAQKSLDASLKSEPAQPLPIRNRILAAGLMGGAVLGFLSVLFGYLKLNHLTRGFYSGRLQTLSIAGVILILGLCYFLWTQVLFK